VLFVVRGVVGSNCCYVVKGVWLARSVALREQCVVVVL